MLRTKSVLISATLLVACSTQAQASELSYSYLELSASDVGKLSSLYEDTQRNSLNGSISFGDRFYGLASYGRTQFKLVAPVACLAAVSTICPDDSTVDEYSAGVGLRQSIGDKADLFVDASFARIQFDRALYNDEGYNGYTLRTGIRAALTERFEGSITLSLREFEVLPADFTVSLTTQFKINNTWGLTGHIEDIGDRCDLGFGVRASF
jgi:hypothetical protein